MTTVRELMIEYRDVLRAQRTPVPGSSVLVEAARHQDVVVSTHGVMKAPVWSTRRLHATPADVERHEQARAQQLMALQDLIADNSAVYEIRKTGNNESPHICIGRAKRNDIIIEDVMVSTLHAMIEETEAAHLLSDQGSSNGTFVNGFQLATNEATRLQTGDCVRFGRRVLYYMTGDRLQTFLGLRIVKKPLD